MIQTSQQMGASCRALYKMYSIKAIVHQPLIIMRDAKLLLFRLLLGSFNALAALVSTFSTQQAIPNSVYHFPFTCHSIKLHIAILEASAIHRTLQIVSIIQVINAYSVLLDINLTLELMAASCLVLYNMFFIMETVHQLLVSIQDVQSLLFRLLLDSFSALAAQVSTSRRPAAFHCSALHFPTIYSKTAEPSALVVVSAIHRILLIVSLILITNVRSVHSVIFQTPQSATVSYLVLFRMCYTMALVRRPLTTMLDVELLQFSIHLANSSVQGAPLSMY